MAAAQQQQGGAYAAPMEQGSYEVRAGAMYNIERTPERIYAPVMAGFGYYVLDGLQFGGLITFEKREWESAWGVGNVWGIGGFGEYVLVLDPDIPVMPSFAVSARLMDTDNRGDMVLVGALSPGVRFFVTETLALALQLDVNLATRDIYNYQRDWVKDDVTYPDNITGEGSQIGWTIGAGVRVLY
jgi:hypothetical protein